MKIEKNRKKILFITVGIFSILLVFFITAVPLAILFDDGMGGDSIYIPPEPVDPPIDPWIPPIPPPEPKLPRTPYLWDISPSIDQDGDIELIWTNSIEADSYEIYRSSGFTIFEIIDTVSINEYTDRGLINGLYKYKIIAKNLVGDSDFSNIESVTVDIPIIEVPTPPSPPPPSPVLDTEVVGINFTLMIYVVLIGGLGIGGFLIYRKIKTKNKKR